MYYSALIGNPTVHSISHIMYEELARAAKVSDAYKHIKVDVEEKELPKILEAFKALHFVGLNVTLPHKLAIIPLLDDVDETVRELGAVNTVKIRQTLTGYNTDWIGIYRSIVRHRQKISVATIFGTGGAARAAIYAAKRLGATTINVLYREGSKSSKTADLVARSNELGITMYAYQEVGRLVDGSDVIINATSAGMKGKDESPIDLRQLAAVNLTDKLYLEVVFNPLQTPLLNYFAAHGAKTIDGLWMMIHQGSAAMGVWLEQDISIADSELSRVHALLTKELQGV